MRNLKQQNQNNCYFRKTIALQHNFTAYFNCCTITLCQKFKSLFDSRRYFNRCNTRSTDDPLFDIDQFSNYVDYIIFVFKFKQKFKSSYCNYMKQKSIII